MVENFPAPTEHAPIVGNGQRRTKSQRAIKDAEPVSAFVFKTVADPFAGRVTYFKVMSGVVKNDANLVNARTCGGERLAHIGALMGKTIQPVTELHAGDIGAVAKLKETVTGDTLDDKASLIAYPPVQLARAVHRVRDFRQEPAGRRPPGQRGAADSRRRSVAALLSRPADQGVSAGGQRAAARRSDRQPLEEALRRGCRAACAEDSLSRNYSRQGRRAGAAQEADRRPRPVRRLLDSHGAAAARREVRIRQRDLRRSHSPATTFPRWKKESSRRPRTVFWPDIRWSISKCTVYDGSYHDVDSSEMAFKLAARKAFKAAMQQAKPAILEPIMNVEVQAPVEYAGDLMGDLNGRRGRIQGMDTKGSTQIVRAQVPMSEMLSYQNDLISMTQGPRVVLDGIRSLRLRARSLQADKIIAAAKAAKTGEEEEEE